MLKPVGMEVRVLKKARLKIWSPKQSLRRSRKR
jgi:hypothetical protein